LGNGALAAAALPAGAKAPATRAIANSPRFICSHPLFRSTRRAPFSFPPSATARKGPPRWRLVSVGPDPALSPPAVPQAAHTSAITAIRRVPARTPTTTSTGYGPLWPDWDESTRAAVDAVLTARAEQDGYPVIAVQVREGEALHVVVELELASAIGDLRRSRRVPLTRQSGRWLALAALAETGHPAD
jgi:hypothetical protein